MTPEQKLKREILLRAVRLQEIDSLPEVTAENVDALYDQSNEDWQLQDAANEVRGGEEETEIPAPYSRHYESKSVAMKTTDGSWIGWTYWYGGGKHGEPEAIDWMEDAYELDCKEEEKLVVVRTFNRLAAT